MGGLVAVEIDARHLHTLSHGLGMLLGVAEVEVNPSEGLPIPHTSGAVAEDSYLSSCPRTVVLDNLASRFVACVAAGPANATIDAIDYQKSLSNTRGSAWL